MNTILKIQQTLDNLLNEYTYLAKGSAKEEKKEQFMKMYETYVEYATYKQKGIYLKFRKEEMDNMKKWRSDLNPSV